jgi:two-component system chemotaxis response regulator CheY
MAKILIVEDQKTMRELIKMTLEAEGHQVTMAGDGVEAMEVVRGATFDLVISDVNMPNMGGISFVSKLKRLDDYKFTPVLMLTTETSQYKKDKARSSGASGWLTKPFTPPRLITAVNKLTRS